MGISDRDYYRERPPSGSGGIGRRSGNPLGFWSVNTWIIVICVAVFVIDGMTQPESVTGQIFLAEGVQSLPPDATPDTQVRPRIDIHPQRVPVIPLLDSPGGRPIGWVEVWEMHLLERYLHFSTQRGFLQLEIWRLFGFQFLHSHHTLWHLLFNMLGLFFFGPLVERHLGGKRYLAFYLLCGIFGALLYTALNLGGILMTVMMGTGANVPFLLFNSPFMPLIGASAGVFGILMAGAYLAPNATVLLFFIIPMRFKVLAYGLVALAFFSLIIGTRNAGGQAGHLGGAMAGWYFIRHPRHLHGFFDFIGWADPTSHHYRNGKRSRGIGGFFRRGDGGAASQREVDRILDKINREGLHSLTEQEKRILRDASRR